MVGDGQAPHDTSNQTRDLDVWAIAAIIWRRRALVFICMLTTVGLAVAFLLITPPQYSSQASIIIENTQSAFARPARNGQDQFLSDQAAVLSQVEVLSSRDLANAVVEKLDLENSADFIRPLSRESLLTRALLALGISIRPGTNTTPAKVVDALGENLVVLQRGTSRVIAVEYTSTDAELAARIANTIAEEYIAQQRVSKFDSNQDAIAWLGREIGQLRDKVAEAEKKVAGYRSDSGIFQTGRDASLEKQQLGQLNAELVRSAAAQSEAEAKARLINELLEGPVSIEEAADVLNSQLTQRLREQQAAVSREVAELSATLLPGHPRMRELKAELSDLDGRISSEARKIARGLKNAAAIAGSRVDAIKETLAQFKIDAGVTSKAEVEMRALEREAAAQREILETFLRRYREATVRQDVNVQAPNARIISRASVTATPSYPPRGPILALASVSGLLLGLMAAIVAEMTGSRQQRRSSMPMPDLEQTLRNSPYPNAPELSGSPQMPAPDGPLPSLATSPQPIGKRISQLVVERRVRRIAMFRMPGDQSSLDISLRLAEETVRHALNPIVVGLQPQPGDGDKPAPGLFDVLIGMAALGEVIVRDEQSGIHMVTAGAMPENYHDLVASSRVALVIDALLRRFDVAFIAAGGMDGGDTAATISDCCDLALVAAPSSELSGQRISAATSKLRASGIHHAAIVSEGPDTLTLYDAVSVRGAIPNAA